MWCSRRLCFRPLLFTLYTTTLSSLIHSHTLDHHLYAYDTQVYIALSTADTDLSFKQLGHCLSDISGWMMNNKLRLNSSKTDFIILGTSRQRCKLTHFFPTNILSDRITPSNTVSNIGVIFDSDFDFRIHISLTCHSCFYLFLIFAIFGVVFLFQLPKAMLQHSLLVGLITATLFFVTLYLRIF